MGGGSASQVLCGARTCQPPSGARCVGGARHCESSRIADITRVFWLSSPPTHSPTCRCKSGDATCHRRRPGAPSRWRRSSLLVRTTRVPRRGPFVPPTFRGSSPPSDATPGVAAGPQPPCESQTPNVEPSTAEPRVGRRTRSGRRVRVGVQEDPPSTARAIPHGSGGGDALRPQARRSDPPPPRAYKKRPPTSRRYPRRLPPSTPRPHASIRDRLHHPLYPPELSRPNTSGAPFPRPQK